MFAYVTLLSLRVFVLYYIIHYYSIVLYCIGVGHGSQPSFEQLASQVSGYRPSYLKTPMVLPSVHNASDIDPVTGEDLDALD